jgi:hypothetical protein
MTSERIATGRVSSRVYLLSGEMRHELVAADSRLVREEVTAVRTTLVFLRIFTEYADRCGFAHSMEVMHEVCIGCLACRTGVPWRASRVQDMLAIRR